MSYLLTSPHKMLILKYKYMGFGNGNLQFTCWAPFCPSPQESQVFRLAAPLSNLGNSCYQNTIFQVPTGANPTSQLGIVCCNDLFTCWGSRQSVLYYYSLFFILLSHILFVHMLFCILHHQNSKLRATRYNLPLGPWPAHCPRLRLTRGAGMT